MIEDRERSVRRLLPMVRTIARRIARLVPASDIDDLIGDGCVGLLRAVDAFDPAIGPSLECYARRVVLGAMLNGIRRLDPVSERVRRELRVVERERYALAAQRGDLPTTREMEKRHPAFARARAEAYVGSPLSLDAPLAPGERVVDDPRADPATIVAGAATRAWVHDAIRALPRRQRSIVVAHYFSERSLRELSDGMGVSPQRVSQLHVMAIARIRRALVATS